jgi:hypothetical protein
MSLHWVIVIVWLGWSTPLSLLGTWNVDRIWKVWFTPWHTLLILRDMLQQTPILCSSCSSH